MCAAVQRLIPLDRRLFVGTWAGEQLWGERFFTSPNEQGSRITIPGEAKSPVKTRLTA